LSYRFSELGSVLLVLLSFVMIIDHINECFEEDYEKHIEQSLRKKEVKDGRQENNIPDHQ